MTTLREAAQQALEALDWIGCSPDGNNLAYADRDRAQAALRTALAQQAEPVARLHVVYEDRNGALRRTPADCQAFGADGRPVAVFVGKQRYVPEPEDVAEQAHGIGGDDGHA